MIWLHKAILSSLDWSVPGLKGQVTTASNHTTYYTNHKVSVQIQEQQSWTRDILNNLEWKFTQTYREVSQDVKPDNYVLSWKMGITLM